MFKDMQTLINFCKTKGFIYQGSEIYGGLANTWDYGALGARLKNNLKDAWRKRFIQERENSYEIDAAILMNPMVWKASGHLDSFYDPKIDCKTCKTRFRADNFITDISKGKVNGDGLSYEEMEKYIQENNVKCPVCGEHNFTEIRKFSQMFETYRGTVEDNKSAIYLRPENAQGEYVNYINVQRTTRAKLPFSIGQVGKAFRNEITPGNFTFRTIEFEQMEFQTFCKKGEDSEIYEYFKKYAKKFFMDLGIKEENLRYHNHEKLAHYAKEACDIEYKFPFGWGEVNGTHNRTDFDLSRHQEFSGKSMEYTDPITNERFIPYIIESTVGADRLFLMIMCDAYDEEILDNEEKRIVLKLKPAIAPYTISVLPLSKQLSEQAKKIYIDLKANFMCNYDETGSIGKRYRRQDEIGTPYCITVDFDTLKDNMVTIRDRDTMKQERIEVQNLVNWVNKKMKI